MRPFLPPFLPLLFPALLLGCDPPSESGGAPLKKGLQDILQNGTLPPKSELGAYDKVTADILSNFAGDTSKEIGVIYVTPDGAGPPKDGSSWEKAYDAADLKKAIDNAAGSEQKPYLVLLAKGSYVLSETLSMKNNVAIVGGFSGSGGSSSGTTTLDGGGRIQVFSNSGLNSTAVLSRVNISKGLADFSGGGMYNVNSSPTLSHVSFFANEVGLYGMGGGMYNEKSSPMLSNVSFFSNTADLSGGGMANVSSSPTLNNTSFFDNSAGDGGGMSNDEDSHPFIVNSIFWGNTKIPLDFSGLDIIPNQFDRIDGVKIFSSIVQEATGDGLLDEDPKWDSLKDNGGFVQTLALRKDSPAIDKGAHIRKDGSKLYYSEDETSWKIFDTANRKESSGDLPSNTIDLTAIDARGYTRTGRPDLGAYEFGGIAP